MRALRTTTLCSIALLLVGNAVGQQGEATYDPLARAYRDSGVANMEATVPPQCYTKTAGLSNPCWTCHTVSQSPNHMDDHDLQEEYAFSDFALKNRWSNLFVDRAERIDAISDDDALAWIRSDNYRALMAALSGREDYPGWVPDLDFEQGFDEDGFALDGSDWRAFRYKPFPGTFWPTNGSTDDVMVRLPVGFRSDADGVPSRAVYAKNLAILEAAIATPPDRIDDVELPSHYVGGASDVEVERYLFPEGTEFLHTVRYVDPDAPTLLSTRMKEVRYSRKTRFLDAWGRLRAFEHEIENKERGKLPLYAGAPDVGLVGDFGWQLQGFIEDADGRLRLQTTEEHMTCMGCHGALGVTVDNTFAFARKVPGDGGWGHQDLRGIKDVPQAGHEDPEILTYFRRVHGGDEFRANREVIERFWRGGELDEAEVLRASKEGDRDITHLIVPSRERALRLTKAYMLLVREQSFELGRDAVLGSIENVHEVVENGSTELGRTGRVFRDGRLWLDW